MKPTVGDITVLVDLGPKLQNIPVNLPGVIPLYLPGEIPVDLSGVNVFDDVGVQQRNVRLRLFCMIVVYN